MKSRLCGLDIEPDKHLGSSIDTSDQIFANGPNNPNRPTSWGPTIWGPTGWGPTLTQSTDFRPGHANPLLGDYNLGADHSRGF